MRPTAYSLKPGESHERSPPSTLSGATVGRKRIQRPSRSALAEQVFSMGWEIWVLGQGLISIYTTVLTAEHRICTVARSPLRPGPATFITFFSSFSALTWQNIE